MTSFSQFPSPPTVTVERRHDLSARMVGAAVAAAAAPTIVTASITSAPRAAAVAVALSVGGATSVLVAGPPDRRRPAWAPHLVTAVAALVAAAPGGRTVGLVALVLGSCTASWWAGAAPSRLRVADGARVPLTGSTVALGALAGALAPEQLRVAPLLALVAAAAGLAASRFPRAVDRWTVGVGRFATAVGRLVAALGVGIVGVVTVVVPWAVQRLLRWDPLWVPRPNGTRLVPVVRGADADRRLWALDPRTTRSTPGRAAHRSVVVLVSLALVAAAVGGTLTLRQLRADRQRFDLPAMADAPWWPDLWTAIDISYGSSPITSFAGVRFVDTEAPGLHVQNGVRRSWRPPADACVAARVWVFGGSAAFGFGQRDEHTVASELARAAWDDGIAIEVENRGVPADTSWMEVRRLELALAEGAAAPDVAIFYGGANDYRVQARLEDAGRGGTQLFANDLDVEALDDLAAEARRSAQLAGLIHPDPSLRPVQGRSMTPAEVGRFAAAGYAAATATARTLLEDRSIRGVWAYQPTLAARTPGDPDEPDVGDTERRAEEAFRAALPDGVLDLSGSTDELDGPVFFDTVHTNEAGARAAGRALWRDAADRIVEGSPCS